ncbi:hypothetical protein BGZ65_004980 [Modicella reniformis]|uniref:Uncharacterized protein n=1 Tax=Modicella reniformis TaxID=1440133 RepID=A0A9P6ST96_9FUNG|nr:hypothetical protein BGZ65_004980 [Modicella reniformis]
MDSGEPSLKDDPLEFEANMFIDRDPITGLLKTWACESSLKVLKLMVTGIPRPDLEGDKVLEEVYPGEGRKIQSQVYDRIARLTNLETSCLAYEEAAYLNNPMQWSCVEMSLESGLDKLSGLKALKELGVSCMRTKIGLKEVQWMTEQWPRLRAIYYLGMWNDMDLDDERRAAVQWLKKHHPEILLRF